MKKNGHPRMSVLFEEGKTMKKFFCHSKRVGFVSVTVIIITGARDNYSAIVRKNNEINVYF